MFPDNFPDSELQAVLGNKQLIYIVVEDEQALEPFAAYEVRHHIELDTDGTPEERKAFATAVEEALGACKETTAFTSGMLMSRAHQREEYMALNGGFLFLGLFLGILFLMITVLIIYYKQTSEGYEDRERFAIMTKVGMGRDVVKAAINTQVRTVFFMPIYRCRPSSDNGISNVKDNHVCVRADEYRAVCRLSGGDIRSVCGDLFYRIPHYIAQLLPDCLLKADLWYTKI